MAATNAMLRLQQMTEEAKKQFHQQSAMNSSGRVVQKFRFFLNSALIKFWYGSGMCLVWAWYRSSMGLVF